MTGDAGLTEQLRNQTLDYIDGVRLLGIQYALFHRSSGLRVKNFSEFFGVVSRNHDFVAIHLMQRVLALEQAFGQPRIRQSEKRIQLRIEGILLAGCAGNHDPAGPHIQPDRLGIDFFRSAHIFVRLPADIQNGIV